MPTYVFYEGATGEIVHVHREYFMGSDVSVEVDERRLKEELGELLVGRGDVALMATDEPMEAVRGQIYAVEPATKRLIRVERPPRVRRDSR